MAYTHERTSARKCAAQILYAGAIRNASALALLKAGDISCLEATVSDYAYSLVEGVEAHLDELDARLASISRNWSIERMPVMDLAILRIALYEMLYVDVVPISVSINEAVEMAKAFGGEDDSPKFVNGMLGNVARELEGTSADAVSAASATDAASAAAASVTSAAAAPRVTVGAVEEATA